jgi:epoxyqueuosine reductase QueG
MKNIRKVLVEKIQEITDAEDIPVLGIGPASLMSDEPPGHRPGNLISAARSLLCFGIPVPLGAYRTQNYGTETIWRSQNQNYRRLDELSLRFAILLEESGEQAVPIYGCMPLLLNSKGETVGCVNQIRMGAVTGIGVIGRNGLLLHSRYGARLMLGGVVTTADLPVIRHPEIEEPGCPPDCRICVDICPVKAISLEKRQVNIMRCLVYTSRTPLLPKIRFLLLRAFRPRVAERLLNQTSVDEHTLHVCSRCVAECPYGSEAA